MGAFSFLTVPLTDTGLYLETTNSDGYAITMPPESVNHSGASVFTLNFIQPAQPVNLVTLIVRVIPTTSSFYVKMLHPLPEEIVFEVTTNASLPKGVYHFSLVLFDPSLGITPPLPVDVTVTVASPGEFRIVVLTDVMDCMGVLEGRRKE